ncbi:MAG: helix-turn-helix domain-containing protein [Clostridia bacterium]|nr:helix-turn-helix domain-containing protein [Clostridia bacterium]
MLKDNRTIKRYSESFKLKVLSELESGKFTKNEIVRIYGIGQGTVYGWIKNYSRFDLLNTQVKVQTMDEKDKVKSLEKRIKQLEKLLVEKDLTHLTDQVYLEDAIRQLGFKDIESFKKKVKRD